jgi:chromosomal replication initiation ATPase DnaA
VSLRQLPLHLPPGRPALGRGDFLATPTNATALAAVEGWRDWPQGRLLLLGPPGSGKTHLAHVFAALCPGARIAAWPAPVQTLAAAPLALEGAETAVPAAQEALFHLVNLMAAEGRPLLLTARRPPRDWGLTLPDLESRLAATAQARLQPPDDALLAALVVKLFADYQLVPTAPALAAILTRIERSAAAATDAVARLDAAALSQRRRITAALVRDVLDSPDRRPQDGGP